jgi:hypothetical protein
MPDHREEEAPIATVKTLQCGGRPQHPDERLY